MMEEQKQNIRNNDYFRYASSKKYLKIFVPDFAFKHDDNDIGKDKFVGRELLFRKLYTWLTSDSKSGSYLVTGYRGMGKSLLVHRVIESISREPKTYKEVLFMLANVFLFVACYLFFVCEKHVGSAIFFLISCLVIAFLFSSLICIPIFFEGHIRKLPHHRLYDKEMVSKFFVKRKDRRERVFENIAITINLGQEVLDERDVLSLIAQNIKDKYIEYVSIRQRRPIRTFALFVLVFIVSFLLAKFFLIPVIKQLFEIYKCNHYYDSWISFLRKTTIHIFNQEFHLIYHIFKVLIYAFILWLLTTFAKWIRKYVPKYSVPYKSIERLNILCDRISSTISEEKGISKNYPNKFFSFSFYNNRKRSMPMANVREIEQELLAIINNINSTNCPKEYQAQFIIVFDELDKITKASDKTNIEGSADGTNLPNFETSVKGFTDTMAYEERKQNVLRLLANMKLFIASVKAKCVFISGHELFDASLADLSDREFAVSSIFNGVLNVSSFLSPEREETDVSSMTEVYVANMLLPEDYLMKKIQQNASDNLILKDEQPSLRWYNEYLMETHVLNDDSVITKEDARKRVLEIRYAIEFLRYFCVYLSHVSNGSPKKIASYFEKYIKTNYDTIHQFDWNDEIVVGVPKEKSVRKQCVLFFNPNDQKLINFVHYLASPVMSAVTNEMSNYGDKLLVSTSFMLDQIYKYHGNGFSWRNLELTPELLTSNKNPELRDSMASILEFLLQLHITPISSGVFQYKFHKQISEEISTLSKISEEAAAIFNFTLNESENVKRYNTRLLEHYINLSKSLDDDAYKYNDVLERIHENLGDIYFSEEDYYRAVHEYRSALQFITNTITPNNVLAYMKCCLKIGMSYEYRRTYENAYMVYCQIINKLVHMKWIEEGELGLDYTMRLTKDWRVKQPVMVDKDSMKHSFGLLLDEQYRRQFRSGLWEDIKQVCCGPRYSLDSDKAISGMAAIYTPEKSDVFLRLTAFEDIKFIYQAIIAKLFVTEKMELSGITQSSIDEAEAEFKTLHNAVNVEEKFMIAADFFSKMAEILYYKNNFVITSPTDNLSSALYTFDINVWEFIDDYCFKVSRYTKDEDAITIKDDINWFFRQIKDERVFDVQNDWWEEIKSYIPECANNYRNAHNDNREISQLFEMNVGGYIDYVKGLNVFKALEGSDNNTKKRIIDCINRRKAVILYGRRLPCNACKYANRSLNILMDKMFVGNDDNRTNIEESRVIRLLLNTSRKHVRNLRQEQVSLLASISEQMADNMLSCACTKIAKLNNKKDTICDTLSEKVITLLIYLSDSMMIPETERQEKIKKLDITNFSTLDRAVLYYWVACRYFEIANMYKEATHCVERIIKVVEGYLSVVYHEMQYIGNEEFKTKNKTIANDDTIKLFENLFNYAAILIGRQYDNYNLAEIHEYKWLFHLEYADNLDLTKLSIFPNLQSIFLSAVNCKVYYHQLRIGEKGNKEYKDYLYNIYHRVAPALQHVSTFKAETESYFMKAYLNRLVLDDILEKDPIVEERKHYFARGKRDSNNLEKEYHQVFYTQVKKYLESNTTEGMLATRIFKVQDNIESKLDLLDFLVVDSMVSLSNILKIVTLHNHITTFPNYFIANIYELLWEWSKFYEMLYFLYIYYRYDKEDNESNMRKIIKMIARTSLTLEENCTNVDEEHKNTEKKTKELLDSLMVVISNGNLSCKDNFGYRYSKLFANVRHEMDDSTIHHIYTNYSAEMAIKYYKAARGINSEGVEYKEMISDMFVLDDDLKNDTCQSNLADERYLLNCGIIFNKYEWIQYIYKGSTINELKNYEKEPIVNDNPFEQLPTRFEDSIYINTEY